MKQIELLAPAKDLSCGKMAIDCGADAVYIGAPSFSARSAAANRLDDIAALVEYAHQYWAKAYVTLNTILTDSELEEAQRVIQEIHKVHADAVIIQDAGLLELDLPPIPIFASTQMHNDTADKVSFLESIGIQRVILARELEINQIKAIREKTNVELEAFIHGSLCVSYSGRCYLSYAAGGRSGNRGVCAQPCRKLYSLVDEKGKTIARRSHLLSIRDLNLSENLKDLIEAGITSFKIEGRLKEKDYVANIVSYYRQKLDEIITEQGLQKSSSGQIRGGFVPDPVKTFQRGFTHYFLHGRSENIGAHDTPKMKGELVGNVDSVGLKSFTLDRDHKIHRGDGICFFDRGGRLQGTLVNDVQDNRTIVPDKMQDIARGIAIYRNHDREFIHILERSHPERKISVKLRLSDSSDGVMLEAIDEDGVQAVYNYKCERFLADKPDQAHDNICRQLAKMGNTHFSCSCVTVDTSHAYFFPTFVLNSLRRFVLEELSKKRLEHRPLVTGHIHKNDIKYPQSHLTYEANILNEKARAFYERHGVTSIEPAAESGMNMHGQRVMQTRYCIKYEMGLCQKFGQTKDNPGQLYLIDDDGNKYALEFDCKQCRMDVRLT